MSDTKFLTKEFVTSYFYDNCSLDRFVCKPVKYMGRTYNKIGQETASTVVGNIYKVFDPSLKLNKYLMIVGVARQHPNDNVAKRDIGVEIASENAMMLPKATIEFDRLISLDEFKEFAKMYISTFNTEFVRTADERNANIEKQDEKITE